ncbi:alpha/beta-hydrolase [Sporormia fimetaria CBS 119925]|uniref:Alpha/beta-hydrolase n=1 Tax=Sporormia fimetaria CBS 119925 TaxID=1340428 RepID=A0A6A6VMK3_9PLEO|nr:alpha/beta-hydrolase [Sporormia fimetaria CBS 119925]
MPVRPLEPEDDRIQHKKAVLNGVTYHYLYGVPPSGSYKGTVFLIHGWPDLSFGWRYQIPMFMELGFRVVAPDMMGYGGTDAPECPPNPISMYGLKRASDDIAELAKQLGAEKIILGGHDWGGFVIWRVAQWYPQLVSHIFSVCTPYTAPHREYISLEQLADGPLPQFRYQIHLASGEVEKIVNDEQKIRQFLKGMYGAKGPNGEEAFDPCKGVIPENLPLIGESRILNGKVLDYYVREYSRHGVFGPCYWYRTRKSNWEEDLALLDKKVIHTPVLFIQATYDSVLKPEMAKNMDALLPNLTRGEVPSAHWALTQKPEEVNSLIRKWLEKEGVITKSLL